jgi:hypothetical protein
MAELDMFRDVVDADRPRAKVHEAVTERAADIQNSRGLQRPVLEGEGQPVGDRGKPLRDNFLRPEI